MELQSGVKIAVHAGFLVWYICTQTANVFISGKDLLGIVAIGKPHQQVCKASHCGSKQQ